jgi:hypothetical protein
VRKLAQQLRRSLTWDRGKEMADHKRFTVAISKEIIRANIGNVFVVERPLERRALGGFLENFEANKRALPRLCGYAP